MQQKLNRNIIVFLWYFKDIMNEKLIKTLKTFKQINPDSNYSKNSLAIIFASPKKTASDLNPREQMPMLWGFHFNKLTPVLSAVFAFLILIGGFYYLGIYPFIPANQKQIVAEADEINQSIQVQLQEIKYLVEQQPTISPLQITAFQGLLNKVTVELQEASNLSKDSEKLEESLQKIKAANQILQEANSILNNNQ